MFFAFHHRMDKAILSDINTELIYSYRAVKDDLCQVIELLKEHKKKHSEDDSYYYKVRSLVELPTIVEIAARFIYLNKTCFNGLYRVNKKGIFNAAKGKYKNPNICDELVLCPANRALKKASLEVGDFSKLVTPSKGDFIYCDPPYHGCHDRYDKSGFTEEDHKKLRDCVKSWSAQGAKVLVSNSDTPFVRNLYAGFNIEKVTASRKVNSDASNRTGAIELLISNT